MIDKQQIELVGSAALQTELMRNGFEVAYPLRDKGVDLIVYSNDSGLPFKSAPIQVKSFVGTSFSVYRKYEKWQGMVMAYVWKALEQPRFFLMTYAEAISILPQDKLSTYSWT